MLVIPFAEIFEKMPPLSDLEDTTLLAVLRVPADQLSCVFLMFDTKFAYIDGHYRLPILDEYLVVLLLSKNFLWTTIRSPDNEKIYRQHVGEKVKIKIQGINELQKGLVLSGGH